MTNTAQSVNGRKVLWSILVAFFLGLAAARLLQHKHVDAPATTTRSVEDADEVERIRARVDRMHEQALRSAAGLDAGWFGVQQRMGDYPTGRRLPEPGMPPSVDGQ